MPLGAGTAYPSATHEFTPGFSRVRITRSLVLCVCFVDRCSSFFFLRLCCLCFFDLLVLITPSVSSSSSWLAILDILQKVREYVTIDTYMYVSLTFTSLSLVLFWQLFYLFCSSIVINTVIVTSGNFEP